MQAYWKDACDEGALAWDDTNNNRAFLAGEISATLNGASIFIAAKRGADKRSEEHTSELQSRSDLVCRLLLEKKKDTPESTSGANLVCSLLLEKTNSAFA